MVILPFVLIITCFYQISIKTTHYSYIITRIFIVFLNPNVLSILTNSNYSTHSCLISFKVFWLSS